MIHRPPPVPRLLTPYFISSRRVARFSLRAGSENLEKGILFFPPISSGKGILQNNYYIKLFTILRFHSGN